METHKRVETHWKAYVVAGLVLLIGALAASVGSGMWVFSAVAVGLLFGFFLQKGDLCGASAFSEVIVAKDTSKLWGLWVCIVTSMVGFAMLDQLSLVTLNPKPFVWMNFAVGGLVFGIGMVLAGGCVSGSLFKAGNGHLTSLAALPGIALGVALVEHGPLSPVNRAMKSYVIKASDGGSITLASLTGLPFWVVALIVAALTVLFAIRRRGPSPAQGASRRGENTGLELSRIVTSRHWKPWKAGIAIGILGAFAYLSSASSGRNYPLGVTHGVYHAQLLVTESNLIHVVEKAPATPSAMNKPLSAGKGIPASPRKKVSWWLITEVLSIVVGAWLAGRASGEGRLLAKPPEQIVIAFIGGCLVGVGAGFAKGCVVGNIMSGWALLSVGTVVFGAVAILANWATAWIYLMGAPMPGDVGSR